MKGLGLLGCRYWADSCFSSDKRSCWNEAAIHGSKTVRPFIRGPYVAGRKIFGFDAAASGYERTRYDSWLVIRTSWKLGF